MRSSTEFSAIPMKEHFATFLKGFAMGAANVVPGVSGGTIAFITGIYERLIEALKAFDLEALKLACSFKIAALWKKIDGPFLLALGLGVVAAFASLARTLKYGLEQHPTLVLSLFFGLIAASIPSVGKMIRRWSLGVAAVFVLGLVIAVSMVFMTPANENANPVYLGLCGVVALCSMIIPGVSGSFVLLLMGNYKLIMLDALSNFFSGNLAESLPILIPVGIGAVVGLLALSRFLSWLFRVHHDQAVGAITGFVAGSLAIIWPWKSPVLQEFVKDGETKTKTIGYENWRFPDFTAGTIWAEMGAVLIGIGLIVVVEVFARKNKES
jgi:putative membrane protein